jgi:hypothetical protein
MCPHVRHERVWEFRGIDRESMNVSCQFNAPAALTSRKEPRCALRKGLGGLPETCLVQGEKCLTAAGNRTTNTLSSSP